ncbi:MAG: DUF2975 domain-containing protein [Pseudomonadota bacterium]
MNAAADRSVSILITLLRVTRWVTAFVIVSIPLTLLNAPFFPLQFGADPADEDAEGRTVYIGRIADESVAEGAMYAQGLIDVMLAAATLYAITQMLGLMRNVAAGHSFVRENGKRLRRIGYTALITQLAIYVVWFFSLTLEGFGAASMEGLIVELTPFPWIVILSVFALATVFNDATTLKEEQDLTV